MNDRVAVIGAGMGGMSAAIRAASRGSCVTVFESRNSAGGLASGLTLDGLQFDAGPYIVLDPLGMQWLFDELGIGADRLELQTLDHVYRVETPEAPSIDIFSDLEATCDAIESQFPGSSRPYRAFIRDTEEILERTLPIQRTPSPTPFTVLRHAGLKTLFLLRRLGSIVKKYDLPPPVADALTIWTHVAGQTISEAPSVLALVPSSIHRFGAFRPTSGMRAVCEKIYEHAVDVGVAFEFGHPVEQILVRDGKVRGVQVLGEKLDFDAVISNYNAIGTYEELLQHEVVPNSKRDAMTSIPMQSPGICAYLRLHDFIPSDDVYLRFLIDKSDDEPCRLFVRPTVVEPNSSSPDTARFVAPQRLDTHQISPETRLTKLLEQDWWKDEFDSFEILGTHTPRSWGASFNLYRNTMNPVMTSKFMRKGRMPHRSPFLERLYFAGASTHPGQWVSFCGISGLHAADAMWEDR